MSLGSAISADALRRTRPRSPAPAPAAWCSAVRRASWPPRRAPSRVVKSHSSRAHGLFPKDDLLLAIRDDGHATVLRDDDREAVWMIVDEAIGRAMPGADIFDVVWGLLSTLGVERAPHAGWRRKLGRHLGAEADQPESLVENHGTVDGAEVRDDAAPFEHRVLELFEIWADVRCEIRPADRRLRCGGGHRFQNLKEQRPIPVRGFAVPEPVLEPQTVETLRARFGAGVRHQDHAPVAGPSDELNGTPEHVLGHPSDERMVHQRR